MASVTETTVHIVTWSAVSAGQVHLHWGGRWQLSERVCLPTTVVLLTQGEAFLVPFGVLASPGENPRLAGRKAISRGELASWILILKAV